MDLDLVNHPGSGRSPQGDLYGLMIDLVRPGHKDTQSMRSVDLIYPGHLDPPKIIFQCTAISMGLENLTFLYKTTLSLN